MSIKPEPWPGLLHKNYLSKIAADLSLFAKGHYRWRQKEDLILLEIQQKTYFFDLDPLIASCIPLQKLTNAYLTSPQNWPGPTEGIIEDVYVQEDNALVLLTQQKPYLKGWLVRLAARVPNIVWIDQTSHPLHPSTFHFSLDKLQEVKPQAIEEDLERLWHQRRKEIQKWRKQEEIKAYFQKEVHEIQSRIEKLTRSKLRAPDPNLVKKEARLLQAYGSSFNEQTKSLDVWDWEEEKEATIQKPKEELHSHIKGLFHKAKGFEKHLENLDHQIKVLKEKEQSIQKQWQECEKNLTLPQEKLSTNKTKTTKNPLFKGIRVFERHGALFLVGKSSEDNMRLSFKIASGNDLWLHVQDYPGSHVVVKKVDKEITLDSPAILETGALLAHHFSSARSFSQIDVSWTFAKWVKKIPGAKSGTVGLQEFHTYSCKQNPTLLAQLLATATNAS